MDESKSLAGKTETNLDAKSVTNQWFADYERLLDRLGLPLSGEGRAAAAKLDLSTLRFLHLDAQARRGDRFLPRVDAIHRLRAMLQETQSRQLGVVGREYDLVREELPAQMRDAFAEVNAWVLAHHYAQGGDRVAQLQAKQLPAMVLVTLHEAGGEMVKKELKKLPGVRKSDVGNLANLVTPNGDLAKKEFVDAEGGVVRLLEKGKSEAAAQQELGTKSLVEPLGKLRKTQDNSG